MLAPVPVPVRSEFVVARSERDVPFAPPGVPPQPSRGSELATRNFSEVTADDVSRSVEVSKVEQVVEPDRRFQRDRLPKVNRPACSEIKGFQPGHVHFVRGRRIDLVSHGTEGLQLGLREQTSIDQRLSHGQDCSSHVAVVTANH